MTRRRTVLQSNLVPSWGIAIVLFGSGGFAIAQEKAGSTTESVATKQASGDADDEYSNFRQAYSAAFRSREASDFEKSKSALNAAIELATRDREKADAHRTLISVHAELGDQDKMFESLEYTVENAPYPAFASLSIGSVNAIARRKGWANEMKARYEKQLEEDPKDRTALVIMEAYTYNVARDHAKRGEYIDRLLKLNEEEGKPFDVEWKINRAFCDRLTRNFEAAAKRYEAVSEENDEAKAFCLMEAAYCWEQAGEKAKAVKAALAADAIGPGKRAKRSLYQWHRTLANLFLAHLKKAEAIKHYEAALEEANIDAYRDQCREKLQIAKALKDS
ncbi:tetratricopeptide repeat protein [Rhodopirellula bahusiensis]|uniref:tetratricopeptide repeat protein n=1 Tax=Rhodopirellula bahusiensis TaxID=2014065 RepID=UPI003266FA90